MKDLDQAKEIFKIFTKRESTNQYKYNFDWPKTMKYVGAAEAELYSSNKWEKDLRKYNEYKHVAEAPQYCYCTKNFSILENGKEVKMYGDDYQLKGFPSYITILGDLLGIQVNLFNNRKLLDERLYEVQINNAKLGAFKFSNNVPGLVIYNNKSVIMVITGDELDIKKEGIIG